MPRFAANLSMMYTEHPFLERFKAAAEDGFAAVEFLFPYEFAPQAIADALAANGLEQVLFNTVPGDMQAGERGLAAVPGRTADFLAGVDRALAYAGALGCKRLHAMAGVMPAALAGPDAVSGGAIDSSARQRWRDTYVANLREAARRCADDGITLLIEPINPRDIPGYFLNTQADAHAIVAEVGAVNLKVQMDLYHCQIVEGDLASRIRQYLHGVGHMQIAGVPHRQEPDLGEVNYPFLFALLDELGYDGWIGCEYRPRGPTSAGLGWLAPWR
ncbi:MAG: 2-oxo-tetronate isomerase [Burkholderiales bacterium]